MSKSIVEARSLVKYFGGSLVIDGVHLEITRGESFAILGGVDSGKSSLLGMIAQIYPASAGDLFISGLNVKVAGKEIRKKVGVCFEQNIFDQSFNVEENLWVYSKFMGLSSTQAKENITEQLRFLDLVDFKDSKIDQLSAFNLRCLSLCRSLIHKPELLVVDELLSGLKLLEQNFLMDRLRDLKKDGKSIVFSTDSYTEASELADRVGILSKGKLQLEGSPSSLVSEQIGQEVVEFVCPEDEVEYVLDKLSDKYEYRNSGNRIFVYVRKGQDSRNLVDMVSSDELSLRKAKLSDVVTKLELSN